MRVAVCQVTPVFDDLDASIRAVVEVVRQAESEAADLVLFPEAFLLGHSYKRSVIEARADALAAGGVDKLRAALEGVRATIVIGAFEQAAVGVTNSALVIGAGRVMGRYAKVHPNEPGVTAGTTLSVFERSGVRFGINICNDANHPELAQRLAEQHVDLIVYPLNNLLPPDVAASWRTRSVETLRARARQTGCWVASADVVGAAGGWVSHGCTLIMSPQGAVVTRVVEGRQGLVTWDVSHT